MLIAPRALQPGGHIRVLAASGPSELERIESAAQHLERVGFRVSLASNVAERSSRGYLAGPDTMRADELNRAFNDPSIDAFFFSRGGYGAMRILEQLDYAAFARDPRPLVGFSDITALHAALATQIGVRSFHGPMLNLDFNQGLPEAVEQWLWSVLRGDTPSWAFDESQVLVPGEAEGILFGGCLALTTALTATPYDFWIDGGIWFWEDVDEPVYRLDRMLTHLRLSGRISRIRGVIIGKLKDCGQDDQLLELLDEVFGSLGVPVVRDFPFGHHGNNLLMPIGTPVRLSTTDRTLALAEPAVSGPRQ
jgi:muramoyltetrapeptide carboxypeptidase